MLTFDQIKELISMVAERQLESVELERSGFRLTVVGRGRSTAAAPAPSATSSPVAEVPPPPRAEPSSEPNAEPADEKKANHHVLESPIVGTFYTAPSPDAEPYVKVGDRVEKGQVICIVEAMKLMNEIECDTSGVVVEVYPQNAQPVEYGEPLFAIDADARD